MPEHRQPRPPEPDSRVPETREISTQAPEIQDVPEQLLQDVPEQLRQERQENFGLFMTETMEGAGQSMYELDRLSESGDESVAAGADAIRSLEAENRRHAIDVAASIQVVIDGGAPPEGVAEALSRIQSNRKKMLEVLNDVPSPDGRSELWSAATQPMRLAHMYEPSKLYGRIEGRG